MKCEHAKRELLPFPMRLSTHKPDDEEPHDEGEEDSHDGFALTVPYFPYGLIFLQRIRIGEKHPVPHFVSDRRISSDFIKFFFKNG